jgi:hypothetical protein
MPSFEQDVHDDLDSSHSLKVVRDQIKRRGGKRDKVAHDNIDEDIVEGDWVQLDDFDRSSGTVKDPLTVT